MASTIRRQKLLKTMDFSVLLYDVTLIKMVPYFVMSLVAAIAQSVLLLVYELDKGVICVWFPVGVSKFPHLCNVQADSRIVPAF
jgi:hypothetical protein